MKSGDLVTVDSKYMKEGWFKLWPDKSRTQRFPEEYCKFCVGEVGTIINVESVPGMGREPVYYDILVLTASGKTGWIASYNLVFL